MNRSAAPTHAATLPLTPWAAPRPPCADAAPCACDRDCDCAGDCDCGGSPEGAAIADASTSEAATSDASTSEAATSEASSDYSDSDGEEPMPEDGEGGPSCLHEPDPYLDDAAARALEEAIHARNQAPRGGSPGPPAPPASPEAVFAAFVATLGGGAPPGEARLVAAARLAVHCVGATVPRGGEGADLAPVLEWLRVHHLLAFSARVGPPPGRDALGAALDAGNTAGVRFLLDEVFVPTVAPPALVRRAASPGALAVLLDRVWYCPEVSAEVRRGLAAELGGLAADPSAPDAVRRKAREWLGPVRAALARVRR